MGKQEFQKEKKVVYLPWRIHCEIVPEFKNDILASRRHTRGNSDTEILKSFENPEKLFRRKNKEQVDFPLFGSSSSPDSHTDTEGEVSTAHALLRTRSESDLKDPELDPHKGESYLLDSFWSGLQQTSKTKTFASMHPLTKTWPLGFPPCVCLLFYMIFPKIILREFLCLMGKVM